MAAHHGHPRAWNATAIPAGAVIHQPRPTNHSTRHVNAHNTINVPNPGTLLVTVSTTSDATPMR